MYERRCGCVCVGAGVLQMLTGAGVEERLAGVGAPTPWEGAGGGVKGEHLFTLGGRLPGGSWELGEVWV